MGVVRFEVVLVVTGVAESSIHAGLDRLANLANALTEFAKGKAWDEDRVSK